MTCDIESLMTRARPKQSSTAFVAESILRCTRARRYRSTAESLRWWVALDARGCASFCAGRATVHGSHCSDPMPAPLLAGDLYERAASSSRDFHPALLISRHLSRRSSFCTAAAEGALERRRHALDVHHSWGLFDVGSILAVLPRFRETSLFRTVRGRRGFCMPPLLLLWLMISDGHIVSGNCGCGDWLRVPRQFRRGKCSNARKDLGSRLVMRNSDG